ncbi:endonuclease domain-containing protein [candidate division KSB1 bacterium]|nr:endonuclease domain-containing protein [candidate division KSB1 bacterium]
MLPHNPHLKLPARELRTNMTDAERLLWSRIRRKQLKSKQFYRQKVIGNYIVDFYCYDSQLVIEVDGGQHYMEHGKESDESRDAYLIGLGLQVLQFSNSDVLTNIDSVVDSILREL